MQSDKPLSTLRSHYRLTMVPSNRRQAVNPRRGLVSALACLARMRFVFAMAGTSMVCVLMPWQLVQRHRQFSSVAGPPTAAMVA